MGNTTYKAAGVDLEAYREAMQRLPPLMHRTFGPRVISQDGGFAGLFRLDFASSLFSRNYQRPVLVACTDGVGTKLKVAQRAGRHDTVGLDLVAMCVNDALCSGAEPLFFLDYVALPADDPPLLESIVRGISDGCVEAHCALLGGETAILPDVYRPGEYDLAGFCVGVVEEAEIIDGQQIKEGDQVIGIASSGLHANGYSLARKIVFEIGGCDLQQMVEELGSTVQEALLRPTRIYAQLIRTLKRQNHIWSHVHGLAHVTGGGLCENTQRVLPKSVDLCFQDGAWPVPPVFRWLQRLGQVDPQEMRSVFNMGIGFVMVVDAAVTEQTLSEVQQAGYSAWLIGEVIKGTGQARLVGDAIE